MARTTAEIDGDSSGLVGALDRGKAAMSRMATEGTKLSDQLREVTDDADRVAGALIEKIGGPTAIKAIAGVGVAMGAAKVGVDAFLGSAESLFRSFGEEGQKVWDETEKSLFAIKGAFAEAVLGGGDVEEMGARLKTIFQGVKIVLDTLLVPLRSVADGLWAIAGGVSGLTLAEKTALETEDKYAKAIAGTAQFAREETKAYDDLVKILGDVVRSKQEAARIEYEAQLASIDARIANNAEQREFRANAAADLAAARAGEALFASAIESTRAKAERELTVVNDGVRQSQRDIDARAREMLLEDSRFRAQMFIAQEDARAQALAAGAKMTADEVERQNELLRIRENFVQKQEELTFLLNNPPKTPPKTGGGGGGPPKEDPVAAAKEAARALAQKIAASQIAFADEQKAAGDKIAAWVAKNFGPQEGLIDSWLGLGEAVKGVYGEVVAAVTRGNEEIATSNKRVLTEEQEGRRAAYELFVAQNVKMAAIDLANGKKGADVARAMIGNVITALGDKAMAMSGIEAATGNFAAAAALTAAGAAAYATAAFLGSTAKKSGSATKATAEKPSTVTTNNTSFNLRVDAAFADEEGIARAFAKAQRLAQSRYLGSASY